MAWFAAHAVMYVHFKDGRQDSYPVWENVLLIEAADADQALTRAIRRAKQDEGDAEGSFTWDERPAMWMYAGIRKLITISAPKDHNTPVSGAELTYMQFEVPDATALKDLVAGEPVYIRYEAEPV